MIVNRFWSSVGSVAALLLGVGLLEYLALMLITGFGLVSPFSFAPMLLDLVAVVGAITYIDWRWSWKPEHIGLSRSPASAGTLLLGWLLGLVAAVLALVGQGLLAGGLDFSPLLRAGSLVAAQPVSFLTLLISLFLNALAIEIMFRGATASRYQADLSGTEALAAAVGTPLAWVLIQQVLRMGVLSDTGIVNAWTLAMSIALSLLIFRTDSVWFSTGLRAGMQGAFLVLSLAGLNLGTQVPAQAITFPAGLEKGALLVWSIVAVVLLLLEWQRYQRTPKRVQPRRTWGGRNVHRGPWGPH